jgi:hypothetical protein
MLDLPRKFIVSNTNPPWSIWIWTDSMTFNRQRLRSIRQDFSALKQSGTFAMMPTQAVMQQDSLP